MSSQTYPNTPGSLSWEGFLDTMIDLGKILGILIAIGLALTLIFLPIFYIYHRCKKTKVVTIQDKVDKQEDDESIQEEDKSEEGEESDIELVIDKAVE
jgi:hypothetical protein